MLAHTHTHSHMCVKCTRFFFYHTTYCPILRRALAHVPYSHAHQQQHRRAHATSVWSHFAVLNMRQHAATPIGTHARSKRRDRIARMHHGWRTSTRLLCVCVCSCGAHMFRKCAPHARVPFKHFIPHVINVLARLAQQIAARTCTRMFVFYSPASASERLI